jgi:hypothetical protein
MPWNINTPKTHPARKKNPTESLAKQLQTSQELTTNNTTQPKDTWIKQLTQGKCHKELTLVRPVKSTS